MPFPVASELFPRFNLASMAGVYPGVRTDTFYRIRAWKAEADTPELQWYQIHIAQSGKSTPQLVVQRYAPAQNRGTPPQVAEPIVLSLRLPLQAHLLEDLRTGLAAHGLRLHTCGSCAHWQATPDGEELTPTQEGVQASHARQAEEYSNAEDSSEATAPALLPPTGMCTWRPDAGALELPEAPSELNAQLTVQSALALGCLHWTPNAGEPESVPDRPDDLATPQETPTTPASARASTPTSASSLWTRLRRAVGRPQTPSEPAAGRVAGERSGISAGTEPCFACHGRLANLGALVVESPEGDPLTYSVWRCRVCRSVFLNQWADRWVRTDTLETDETLWRVPPIQASQALTLIRGQRGGDHPQGRGTRGALAQQLERLAQAAALISRQIKQGR